MAGEGMSPAPARTDNNVSYHRTNQPIWLQYDAGQIPSQLFWNNSMCCTRTVWTFQFKNEGLVSKKGVSIPHPPGCATDRNVLKMQTLQIIGFFFIF